MLVGMVEGYLDVKFEVGYRVGFGEKEMYFFVGVESGLESVGGVEEALKR